MKNQKLLLLVITPFIVMACDLINEVTDCSTAPVLRQYNILINDIAQADTSDCIAIAEALDSAIVFVEDNKACVVASFTEADSTINALEFVNGELEQWKTVRTQYDECAGSSTVGDTNPCSEDSIAATKYDYKMAYYDAFDSRNCEDIKAAIDSYITYLEENRSCIAESSSEAKVDAEIATFVEARKIILESNCHPDVLKTFNLFKAKTAVSEMSCTQAISAFVKSERLYDDALIEQNCHSLVLNAEYLMEIYNNKTECLVDFVADKFDYSKAEAREKITKKINAISEHLKMTKSNCSGFEE
ncbi:hypothetical protein [Flammeovirga sp. EKP202]|uniref:hypothetical protein n=1 Tax=Flammeovirga sp. EKP202 TaxID=2770592 RepID=UPI00165FB374|nr:hypothetical protein [Flammeovirga sp. EKP202]MBD0404464.1 hypothetical protein [Flammeovirga sp. EKP202]